MSFIIVALLGFALIPPSQSQAAQPLQPIKQVGDRCPLGFLASQGYCIPLSDSVPGVIPIYGDYLTENCPRGYRNNNGYCQALPAGKSVGLPLLTSLCPRGYLRSGSYCLKSI